MKGEGFWVMVVSIAVAAICAAAAIILSIREELKSGRRIWDVILDRDIDGRLAFLPSLWGLGLILLVIVDAPAGSAWMYFVPGIRAAYFLASLLYVSKGISYSFDDNWSWKYGLRQALWFVFPLVLGMRVFQDVTALISISSEFLWIVMFLEMSLFAPFAARLLYYELRQKEEASNSSVRIILPHEQ